MINEAKFPYAYTLKVSTKFSGNKWAFKPLKSTFGTVGHCYVRSLLMVSWIANILKTEGG